MAHSPCRWCTLHRGPYALPSAQTKLHWTNAHEKTEKRRRRKTQIESSFEANRQDIYDKVHTEGWEWKGKNKWNFDGNAMCSGWGGCCVVNVSANISSFQTRGAICRYVLCAVPRRSTVAHARRIKCERRTKFKSIALMSAYCHLVLFQFLVVWILLYFSLSHFDSRFVLSRGAETLAWAPRLWDTWEIFRETCFPFGWLPRTKAKSVWNWFSANSDGRATWRRSFQCNGNSRLIQHQLRHQHHHSFESQIGIDVFVICGNGIARAPCGYLLLKPVHFHFHAHRQCHPP